nr:DegT/DnrJ/EryC1/StrS family aminotransferase [Kibdelosporangium sp. MJ126-NF4]CTQ98693.1 DegT/DnrJ/EryC1/StrS aminotransferase [Kibdelosporangium sp. MJ126-NF4]
MTGIASARSALACNGGSPVRDPGRPWPRWPVASLDAERNLLDVLYGDRWTLTAPLGRAETFERRFARMFARYTGTRHCVPVDHGSSALVIALESLGLRPADRVLVPALTWTASATAALRAGLVPVLVDVDPDTGCLSPDTLDLSVDARAVVAVHWSCAMADIPAITDVANRDDMVVIEDCAQSHGAEWLGRRAGSMGRIGCFSMQQGKVLTCGEGGAVVTDDDALAPRLEELRADSRRYRSDAGRPGEQELLETAGIMGVNFCLGEFQAAVLCAQLEMLDRQHEIRARNFAALAALVDDIPGVRLVRPAPAQTRMSVYEVPFVFDRLSARMTNADIATALTAELHTTFYITDTPLHVTPLLRPWTKSTLAPLADQFVALHQGRTFPNASHLFENSVVTHHSSLLGTEQDMADIATAVAKVAALVQD